METESSYQSHYKYIFAFFYLIEGFVQGIPFLVFPAYLTKLLGNQFDISLWLIILALSYIPWSIKIIVGFANDKWGSRKYGRRFPWIASFGIYCGIWWIIMAIYLPVNESIYLTLGIYYFMIALGMAFADTALDGLILDTVPKEKLGKIQGYTWTCLLLGMGAGGMLLGLIFLALDIIPILFVLTGVLVIIACLLTRLIKEPPLKKVELKDMGQNIKSLITKKKNWKVYGNSFIGAMAGVLIGNFFGFLILINIGIIDVDQTILSIKSGNPVELLGWASLFNVVTGIGIVIGSITAGKLADKGRRKTLTRIYCIYIPLCIISVIPFLILGEFLFALIYGLIVLLIFGVVQGALVITTQTINGDIAKNEYPDLKSSFYALLISWWNGGQAFSLLLGAFIFIYFANYTTDFFILYFLISLFGAFALFMSYLCFRAIDPSDYEFKHVISVEKD